MNSPIEVVITGVGIVSPIGIGRDAFWKSIVDQRSGVGPITQFDPSGLPVRFGGEVGGFNPKLYVKPRKSIKVMSREVQLGFSAAALAVEDAAIDTEAVDSDRFGVVYGSEMIYGDIQDLVDIFRNSSEGGHFHFDRFSRRIESDVYPLWMLKNLPNMAACHVGIAYDARGPSNTVVQGDVSSLLAVAECVSLIQRGCADVMIAGGTGSRLNITGLMYRGDLNLSHRNDDPARASRPFDANRDGMVNGEGAAAFVLESKEHALARGARIFAHIRGTSSVGEPFRDVPSTDGRSLRRSIESLLLNASLNPDNIDHVNADGVSTVADDACEARAIAKSLGDVAVTAPKSYFGNLGGGTGAVELAASVLAFEHGLVLPTLNYSQAASDCPITVIHSEMRKLVKRHAIVLNKSPLGYVAGLLLERYD